MKASEFLKNNPVTEALNAKLEKHLQQLEHARILRAFINCATCGHELAFHSRTDWTKNQVQETGGCAHCQREIPTRIYSLC